MGMGYGANFAYVITEENVAKVCSEELAVLQNLLKTYNVSIDEFAMYIEQTHEIDYLDEDQEKQLYNAFVVLCDAFQKQTGLTLCLNYHDSDTDGDRYDEVDGAFFTILFSDIVALTPQAEQAKEKGVEFGIKHWVSYG